MLSSANVSSWVGDRAHSSQLDCPLLVLLLFRSRNPLHWSLASVLIWGTISPADGSLLKHHERSELIPISPLIPVISQLSSLSLDITPSFLTLNTWLFFPNFRALANMPSNGVIVSAWFITTWVLCFGRGCQHFCTYLSNRVPKMWTLFQRSPSYAGNKWPEDWKNCR